MKKIKILSSIHGLSVFLLLAMVVVGCQSSTIDYSDTTFPAEIEFMGNIEEMMQPKTRLDTAYINSYLYDTNFYIQQTVSGTPNVNKYGVYKVPSGYEGRLNSVESNKALMWEDLTSDHTFYAWTLPWDETFIPDDENISSIEITFNSSSDAAGYDEYKNNAVMEQFVGARSGPYSYIEHGKYVDLTFRHLVSKIKIGTFQLIEGSGAIQKNLKADITFIGMPNKATFYPHPENDLPPYMIASTPDENDGVTFYIANDVKNDYFYIPPEVNFNTINYQVKLRNEEYVNQSIDIYYGTFDTLHFERVPETDYDKGDGSDEKVLHAGEMMTMDITLIPGIGPGLAVTIDKWSTEDFDKDDETLYHTYPGMYSDSEVKNVLDIFSNMNNDNFCDNLAEMERLFELYGDEVEGNFMLFIYENVTVNSNIFPIYKKYILNGLGHIVTMNTNYGNGGGAFGSSTNYFNIGPARDIYLSNPQGTIKLYIDAEGFVWIYNSNTNTYTKTENQLTELEGNEKSYDIDSVTGKVRKSNYFNNGLGENPTPFPSCEE